MLLIDKKHLKKGNFMSNILTKLSQNNEQIARLIEIIHSMPDPRVKKVKHPFESIIIIIICASIAGANNDIEMEEYAKNNIHHLKKIIDLPYGAPSHNTINRMLCALNPKDMSRLIINQSVFCLLIFYQKTSILFLFTSSFFRRQGLLFFKHA